MDTIVEISDSSLITNIVNTAFMTVALQFNLTKERVRRFPAFIGTDVIEDQLSNGLKMYGYRHNEQIAGCIGYTHYKDEVYLIERLATLPEYRHLGIGRKLMEFAENKIKESGGKTAELHAIDINVLLVEWYKKMNYRQIRVDILTNSFDKTRKLPFNSCVMNKELV